MTSRAGWGARPPRYTTPLNFSLVNKFIIHYSGASRSQSVRSIQNYSMDTKGYSDIDYNYLVKDGRVYVGRGTNIGGHTYQNNSSSIGVCVIGQDGDATQADFAAIAELYAWIREVIGRKELRVMGHRDANPGQTDCPGDQIEAWINAGMPVSGGSEDDMFSKKGDANDKVLWLQATLSAMGHNPGPLDGEYGGKTQAAVLAAFATGDGTEFGPWQFAKLVEILFQRGAGSVELAGRQITLEATITQAK